MKVWSIYMVDGKTAKDSLLTVGIWLQWSTDYNRRVSLLVFGLVHRKLKGRGIEGEKNIRTIGCRGYSILHSHVNISHSTDLCKMRFKNN